MRTNELSFDLPAYLKSCRKLVNDGLTRIFTGFDQNRELIRAMDHSLMAGGKRLRPILALASAQACGGNPMLALPAGCAIELIHTYSLIHDDLPAMDDDDLRRGVPTCHKKFSEATAILAGDGLLTHAFRVLSRPHDLFEVYPDNAVLLKVIADISLAAGIDGMVEGQMLDMQSQELLKKGPSDEILDRLIRLHTLKTGRMISVSVDSGVQSANGGEKLRTPLLKYADSIGLAFQVMDDILNIEGDPKIMGKAAGSDAASEKTTFPAVMGLSRSKEYAEKLIRDAWDALEGFDQKADPLRAIARYIVQRKR
ncbi:polyprenyl synthetase family protein [Desulfospira joergensenii]|uniref:polyprenyl synthetase family protein n=1 Tax=Desulfospira joergensenii TaxID=53329 RepID=UPI0003B6809E|nr:farnesyl diphosphate synthase [Desulfospira joergensenii]